MAKKITSLKLRPKKKRSFQLFPFIAVFATVIVSLYVHLLNVKNRAVQLESLTAGALIKSVASGELGVLDSSLLSQMYSIKGSYMADNLWIDIIDKGAEIMEAHGYAKHLVVFEVGAQSLTQSLYAIRKKFHTHCIEPSPRSFKRMVNRAINEVKKDPSHGQYIHLYNAAASGISGETLDFGAAGGTGDHVGEFDMWNMKPGKEPDDFPENKKTKMVKVSSVRVDDIILDNSVKAEQIPGLEDVPPPPKIDHVHAIKVDTQGFEPNVFAGLKESIKQQKIDYVLTEYWPNGIGLLNYDIRDKCEVAVEMLTTLIDSGYKLYALPLAVHGSVKDRTIRRALADWRKRPLNNLMADCYYILDLEKQFPQKDYHMGYWTDVLAIAPNADPIIELRSFGKKL